MRATLHHNDYHYRFYHYLGGLGGEIEEALVREITASRSQSTGNLLGVGVKAFKHWRAISLSLHELFDRAPREAITDPVAVIARMATEEVKKGNYSVSVENIVRERAERTLARCTERDKGLIDNAIAESKRLLNELDKFVALFDKDDLRLAADEAEQRVREFLDNCRRLDRGLSDIPRRLRESRG